MPYNSQPKAQVRLVRAGLVFVTLLCLLVGGVAVPTSAKAPGNEPGLTPLKGPRTIQFDAVWTGQNSDIGSVRVFGPGLPAGGTCLVLRKGLNETVAFVNLTVSYAGPFHVVSYLANPICKPWTYHLAAVGPVLAAMQWTWRVSADHKPYRVW